ncbi:MAG: hypothetical protein CVT94_09105 [Bacteroidetes bacterium HGW-Bacteroidetes-11]|jgi:hypothetical protein|nr:MAG: hypothetical protein CVT94_09105 [Bacteroidetes bacterium HGW-Bacteroidetes-11]
MRKKTANALVILIVLVLLKPDMLFGQYKSVAMGVKLAPNIGWLKVDGDGYYREGIVPGLSWGLITDFYFAQNYAFSTGFTVSFHNGRISYPDIQSDAVGLLDRRYRLKYIDIPLMVKMKTNQIDKFRFFGQIGVQPGVRIASKAKDTFIASSPVFTVNRDWHNIDSQTHLFRATMIVGAGIEYPIDKSSAIVAGINFVNGLSDALKGKNAVDGTINHKGIPNAFELSLGVIF